jgi:hypothetical protein
MGRYVLASGIRAVRSALAICIALVAIAGATYLGTHRFNNPYHYDYGDCVAPQGIFHGYRSCSRPSLFAWQIPLALVIGVGGVGVAVALTSRGRGDVPKLHRLPLG